MPTCSRYRHKAVPLSDWRFKMVMIKIQQISLLLCLLLSWTAQATEAFTIPTPRGELIEIIVDQPEKQHTSVTQEKLPTVILASGSGYHARLPLLEKLAATLRNQGFGVIRFNWAYYVKDPVQGKQSANRVAELEDIDTAIAFAKKQDWVDTKNIVIGGKSLGSIIAWQTFRKHPELKAALLLTPVCQTPAITEANYPEVNTEVRPSAWILGNNDPACPSSTLYRLIGSTGNQARVITLGGDHSFAFLPKDSEEAILQQNHTLDLATDIATDFIRSSISQSAK